MEANCSKDLTFLRSKYLSGEMFGENLISDSLRCRGPESFPETNLPKVLEVRAGKFEATVRDLKKRLRISFDLPAAAAIGRSILTSSQ